MIDLLSHFVPNQGGVLVIGGLIAFVVFGDLERPASRKNVVLLALLALSPFLVDLITASPGRVTLTFRVLFALTAAYALWAYRLSRSSSAPVLSPKLGRRELRTLLIAVLALDALIVFGRHPDDAGVYTNLAAQRWVETGRLPYGDPLMTGPESPGFGASATYGPLLMAAHVPFQFLLGPNRNPPESHPLDGVYRWPPGAASQLACFAFLLLGVWGLYQIVKKSGGVEAALGAALLYAGSPYVLGLGGDQFSLGGLTFISHIAPSAVTVLAFLYLSRPMISGGLLAAGAGFLFYPAFLFPAWLGWHAWADRKAALKFALGFALVGLGLAALVIVGTEAPDARTAVELFLQSTVEHQEGAGPREYGASTLSFWGTHPTLSAIFHTPVLGEGSLFKPTFMVFAGLCLAAGYLARGRNWGQLAALSAMIPAALQLWKTHAAGTYVEWYYPFLVIALLGGTVGHRLTGKAKHSPDARGEPVSQEA